MKTTCKKTAARKRATTTGKKRQRKILRIGILGSGANPWGNSHAVLGDQSLDQAELDFVLLMPVGQPVDKKVEPKELRWEFTEVMEKLNPGRFVACREEIDRDGPSYMIDTLRALRRKYGRYAKFFLIVGEDRAEDLKNWKDAHLICRMATVLCGPRYGCEAKVSDEWLKKVLPRNAKFQAIEIEYSMTWVRKRLAMGKSVRFLVPDAILEVVRKHGAYVTARPVTQPAN